MRMEIFTLRKQKARWLSGFSLAMLLLVSATAIAQNITISGTVKDETGMSLPGVNVLLKGTNIGVTTDSEGKYTIAVNADGTLVFSFVGYSPQEEFINNRTVINISLT